MNKIKKHLFLVICLGLTFNIIEMYSRVISGALIGKVQVGKSIISAASLAGWSSAWMVIVGGICGLFLGMLNEWKYSKKFPLLLQGLIGLVFILSAELTSGIVLNIWLGLGIWDYSGQPFNFMGQICLKNGFLFLLITPFAFWIDDTARYAFFGEKKQETLGSFYKRFFTLK